MDYHPKPLTLNEVWKIHVEKENMTSMDLYRLLYPDDELPEDVDVLFNGVVVGLYANHFSDFVKFVGKLTDVA